MPEGRYSRLTMIDVAAVLPEDALIRGSTHIGDVDITVCSDGTCLFDGGAMFGVVPKPVWSRKVHADAQNRVLLGLNCVVVKAAGKTLLIETGFGNKLTPKLRELYGTQERLPESLAAAGVSPESVDIVINTHLHWDHCSWNTVLDADGVARPFFPNAQYITHRGEVEHGHRQFERDRISYVSDNYDPLIANGQIAACRRRGFYWRCGAGVSGRSRCLTGGISRTYVAGDGGAHREWWRACLLRQRPDTDERASGSDVGDGV